MRWISLALAQQAPAASRHCAVANATCLMIAFARVAARPK
jgi:hypothetical protein